MGIHLLSADLTGIPAPDAWTAYQFDSAVIMFGMHIENKLNELTDKGKQKHKLKDLLSQTAKQSFLDFFETMRARGNVTELQ